MTSRRPASPRILFTARSSTVSESMSITSTKLSSDNLYNISPLLKYMRGERTSKMINLLPRNSTRLMNADLQQQIAIKKSMHKFEQTPQFPFNRLKNKEKRFDIQPSTNEEKKHPFNTATYCLAYCAVIIIGTTLGGWIGGLFEFITGGYNGCNNEYRGHFKCQMKYGSMNVSTHCINIFYEKSIPNDSPYICLCRFRNQSKAKYRHCEFLHAKIQSN